MCPYFTVWAQLSWYTVCLVASHETEGLPSDWGSPEPVQQCLPLDGHPGVPPCCRGVLDKSVWGEHAHLSPNLLFLGQKKLLTPPGFSSAKNLRLGVLPGLAELGEPGHGCQVGIAGPSSQVLTPGGQDSQVRSGGLETRRLVRLRPTWSQRPSLEAASTTTDHQPDADAGQSSHPPPRLCQWDGAREKRYRRHFSTPPRTRPRDRGCHALRQEPTSPTYPEDPLPVSKGTKECPQAPLELGSGPGT